MTIKSLTRSLRKRQTDAERLLWRHLRGRRFAGYKFRRQAAIDPYIVDFVCFEPKLVVEADGGQHGELASEDAVRTAFLESRGYTALRFWNHEILNDTNSVLEKILAALISLPSPRPLPEGEGEQLPTLKSVVPSPGWRGGTTPHPQVRGPLSRRERVRVRGS